MEFHLFYLENRTSPKSNVAHFWRKGGCGYTAKLEDAQTFSEQEADQVIKSAEGSHLFIKHHVGDVECLSFRAVNIDDLPVSEAALIPKAVRFRLDRAGRLA